MKALHIVKTAHAANWVLHQVRVLIAAGVEIAVALPSQTEGLAPQYRAAGATVCQADFNPAGPYPWKIPGVMQACRELVARVRPGRDPYPSCGDNVPGARCIGQEIFRFRASSRSPAPSISKTEFFAWTDLRLSGPQDFWIATCKWTRDRYLAMGVAPSHVFLSYAGTDITPFGGERTGVLRRALGISPDAPLVGMVAYMYAPKWILGQHRGVKGHEDFIAALSRVRERRPEVRGIIVGGPWNGATWYEQRLRDLGVQTCNGSLYFTGSRNDVAQIYPDLDLAVVPSLSENLGGAAEPLLSGVPVVASNVGGLPDLIHDGETGWLVPSASPVALAAAIEDALSNHQEAQSRTALGKALARQLVDAERTGREVAGIYENILSPRATAAAPQE